MLTWLRAGILIRFLRILASMSGEKPSSKYRKYNESKRLPIIHRRM